MTTLNPTLATVSTRSTGIRTAAAIAFLIGLFVVTATGLAGADAIHNATHDTRHAFGLPCH